MPPNLSAEILSTHTPELFRAAVVRAAELLRAGEVVALPTETVYGLAANALDADAVSKIYEIKGRPAQNPIIVHVSGVDMAKRCVAGWPAIADQLAKSFWPGPLTIVLPRAAKQTGSETEKDEVTAGSAPFQIPDVVTAGGSTVGLRWPSHPFIQAVIRQCDFPLAAPSANLSLQLSPTNAGHVRGQLGDRIPLIVDGGQSQVGIESTVLDLTVSPPAILRPGMIHEESLAAVCGQIGTPQLVAPKLQREGGSAVGTPHSALRTPHLRSPGLLRKHYAPKAKLFVMTWPDEGMLSRQIGTLKRRLDTSHVIAHSHIPSASGFAGVSVIPHDAEAFARAIYSELHRCDELGAETIIVEAPPEGNEWRAIADRLRRAADDEG